MIKADDENTWPSEILISLEEVEGKVREYQLERQRIERLCRDDIHIYINTPENMYLETWETIISKMEHSISGSKILGYHVTRLTDREIKNIICEGLKVLSLELLEEKLKGAAGDGYLSEVECKEAISNNQVEDMGRVGTIHFCFSSKLLRDENGVIRLLSNWGGEALYNTHEKHTNLGLALRGIGRPCIVISAIPVHQVNSYCSVAERLLNIWCSNRNICTGSNPLFEGHITNSVNSENIQSITSKDEDNFSHLTNYKVWDNFIN